MGPPSSHTFSSPPSLLPLTVFSPLKESQVSLQSLLGGLGGVKSKSLQALKKRLSTVEERNDPVEPPLNKIQADKVGKNVSILVCCLSVFVVLDF